jgi:SHS2 domain-containing protein
MYEHFEHTADLGMRVRAADLEGLFVDAARGLAAMIVDNPDEIRPEETVRFEIKGDDLGYLLFDWLNELLYTFESRRLLLSRFELKVSEAGVVATGRGEVLDLERHLLGHEVKAITYHALHVSQTAEGWEAEVIVDI